MVKKVRISKDLPGPLKNLPVRRGEKPKISIRYPCLQERDPSPEHLIDKILQYAGQLPNVTVRTTEMNVPGGMALVMNDDEAEGQPEAYIFRREFAIVRADGSIHLPLMPEWGARVMQKRWGTIHPVARYLAGAIPPQHLIIYAPLTVSQLKHVQNIITAGYFYALGWELLGENRVDRPESYSMSI